MSRPIVPAPGVAFAIAWKRQWLPFWRGRYGAGQVLAIEEDTAVVHIRIFSMDAADDWPYMIGLLPILAPCLKPHVRREWGTYHVGNDHWGPLNRWRRERARGEASCFDVALPIAVDLAFRAVNPEGSFATPQAPIEAAYPVRGETGEFSAVRAFSWPRS